MSVNRPEDLQDPDALDDVVDEPTTQSVKALRRFSMSVFPPDRPQKDPQPTIDFINERFDTSNPMGEIYDAQENLIVGAGYVRYTPEQRRIIDARNYATHEQLYRKDKRIAIALGLSPEPEDETAEERAERLEWTKLIALEAARHGDYAVAIELGYIPKPKVEPEPRMVDRDGNLVQEAIAIEFEQDPPEALAEYLTQVVVDEDRLRKPPEYFSIPPSPPVPRGDTPGERDFREMMERRFDSTPDLSEAYDAAGNLVVGEGMVVYTPQKRRRLTAQKVAFQIFSATIGTTRDSKLLIALGIISEPEDEADEKRATRHMDTLKLAMELAAHGEFSVAIELGYIPKPTVEPEPRMVDRDGNLIQEAILLEF